MQASIPIKQDGNLLTSSSSRVRPNRFRSTTSPFILSPCSWNTFLAKSMPRYFTLIFVSLQLPGLSLGGGRRAVHPINWRRKFGGIEVSEAKRLKALEAENAKLKKMLAEQMMDVATLKEMLEKNF